MERLGSQVGIDKDFERVAGLLICRKVRDALFKVGKPCDAVEEFALEIQTRFGMFGGLRGGTHKAA